MNLRMSTATLSFEDLIEINKPQVAEFQRLAELFPDSSDSNASATFSKQVRLVEGVLVQTYGIAAKLTREIEDLPEIAEVWKEMADFCNLVLQTLLSSKASVVSGKFLQQLARRASRLLAGGGAKRNPRIPIQRAIHPGRGGRIYATNLPDTTLDFLVAGHPSCMIWRSITSSPATNAIGASRKNCHAGRASSRRGYYPR